MKPLALHTIGSNPLRQRLRVLSRERRADEARQFLEQFHHENGLPAGECAARVREVERELLRTGHYDHTPEELAFGARVAWRNHARCIGRLFWKGLEVADCRHIDEPDAIASRMVDHMQFARGDGRIRSTISIFAPVKGDAETAELPSHIESRQIAQYAGYMQRDGRVVGDPIAVEATNTAIALGWNAPAERGAFDLLPIVVCDGRGRRHVYELPPGTVQELDIVHPRAAGLAALGLRWYTVPCVSSMVLSIGGIEYPCAPFNGFYMASEIASRNFVDETRYNMLEPAADALGVDRSSGLWKDRVVTELNEAVIHSFRAAGATILDHHTASEQFMDFHQKEVAAGRTPSAEWSWIVPPQASSLCPVYHLPMRDRHLVPNYYASAATDGARLAPGAAEVSRHESLAHGAAGSRCPFARSVGAVARGLGAIARAKAAMF